jgi:hypothetical protein
MEVNNLSWELPQADDKTSKNHGASYLMLPEEDLLFKNISWLVIFSCYSVYRCQK